MNSNRNLCSCLGMLLPIQKTVMTHLNTTYRHPTHWHHYLPSNVYMHFAFVSRQSVQSNSRIFMTVMQAARFLPHFFFLWLSRDTLIIRKSDFFYFTKAFNSFLPGKKCFKSNEGLLRFEQQQWNGSYKTCRPDVFHKADT